MKERNKHNEGAILPIVLLAMVLAQIMFYTVLTVYQAQMELNLLLSQHYQTQTILLLSEDYLLHAMEQVPLRLEYNIGSTNVEQVDEGVFRMKSTLHSGYTEEKILIIEEEETEEADANAASLF